MATRTVTELDFDQLKADIIDFISTNPTFTDYNFEGSALNAIADMLAYNSHNNAYYANMLHNEGFLDTAQKRSSVVSKSKELGYVPRSAVCSTAVVDILAVGDTTSVFLELPRGTVFTSSNENGSYSFIVAEDVLSTTTSSGKLLSNVKLLNGTLTNNYFTVDTTSNIRSIFTIPNSNVDTSSLKVYVRESSSSVDRVEYFLSSDIYEQTATSKIYFLQESYSGFFQIYFGNDVIGKQPIDGNVIDIEYAITTDYALADGCKTFDFTGTLGNATSLTITTSQVSFAGSDKESIDNIKYNAVKANSAKGRTVTEDDYIIRLKEEFNFIKSVSVWGGETNDPPVYGKVFISIQPVSGYTISDSVKQDVILPIIKKNNMLTISPVFVDPEYLTLEFLTKIKFNPSKTTSTQLLVEGNIQTVISSYISAISEFKQDFLHSTLVSDIAVLDPGIVSVNISKYIGFRLSPLIGVVVNHQNTVNNPIIQGSIKTTKFNILRDSILLVTIKEVTDNFSYLLNSDGTVSILQTLGMYTDAGVLVETIGYVNLTTGKFNISFDVYSYITNNRFVAISCILVDDDIITSRNQILSMGVSQEDSTIGLLNNNIVQTEIYGK